MFARAITLTLSTVVSCAALACGGQTLADDGARADGQTSAVAVYTTASSDRCPAATATTRASEILKKEYASEEIAVVAITYEDECTGLGGQYILASDVSAPRQRYFLGAHGCSEWTFDKGSSAAPAWGVLRYQVTDSIQKIPAGVCVGNATNQAQGIITSAGVRGIALFTSRSSAETFARSVGWQP